MFRMMTPIDAISYGLRAGMVLGQTQTLWATRLLEMQGFWLGFPALVSDLPKVSPTPAVTELHVEATAETLQPAEAATAEPPAISAAAPAEPNPIPRHAPPKAAPTAPLAE